jgi:hypothetical protein
VKQKVKVTVTGTYTPGDTDSLAEILALLRKHAPSLTAEGDLHVDFEGIDGE